VKTFSPKGTQIRCKMCGQRFDRNGELIKPSEEL